MKVCILIPCLVATLLAIPPARADTSPVQIIWQLLDYIAVDYPGAVQDGTVISQIEFVEMVEFSDSARKRIHALPASSAKAGLEDRAEELQTRITSRASVASVARTARSIAADLIEAYPIPLIPVHPPDIEHGRDVYEQHCISCHGRNGDGAGPASFGLTPPPIAFRDKPRAKERSIFALYQVIEQGLEGTSMLSFSELPAQDRWDVAFYISTLAYPERAAEEGEQIWNNDPALHDRIDLATLVGTTPASLEAELGESKAEAVTAFLRHHPTSVLAPTRGSLAQVRTRLEEAFAAYAQGDSTRAVDLALAAYLDGFEPIEPVLATRDNALRIQVEDAMGTLRASLAEGRPVDDVRTRIDTLNALLSEVESVIASGRGTALSSYISAFTVLLREGLEALLIVAMMMTFIRKTDRSDLLPYAHGGWISALVAGGLTWVAATYFIHISGANRELMEGFSSIISALILLWVGIWMHSKSSSEAWQRYVFDKLNHGLNHRSAWFLFGFSFLVVYREAFETILFYIAIWNHGNGGVVLAGAVSATAVLIVIAWGVLRYSRALPLNQFFTYSSLLLAVLAVILTGKGVASLQEAGYLLIHPLVDVPRIAAIGLFPTREGVMAQLIMIVLLLAGLGFNRYKANRSRPTPA